MLIFVFSILYYTLLKNFTEELALCTMNCTLVKVIISVLHVPGIFPGMTKGFVLDVTYTVPLAKTLSTIIFLFIMGGQNPRDPDI